MKKLKRFFGVFALTLFLMSMAPSSTIIIKKSCIQIAVDLHNDLQEAGVSHADAYAISESVLNACESAQN